MSADTAAGAKTCGAFGCQVAAYAVIDHLKLGELVACESCAQGHEVVRHV